MFAVCSESPPKTMEFARIHKFRVGILALYAGELLKEFKERYYMAIFVFFKAHYGAMFLING